MKKFIPFLVLIALLAAVTAGYAQVKAGSFSVTPFIGGYVFEGNEAMSRNAAVAGLRAGYNFTSHCGLEGYFNYVPAKLKDVAGDDDMKLYGYGIEAIYNFRPEKRLVPFVALGVGGSRYSPPGAAESYNRFTADYGAGLKFFLTDWLALRADVRHVLPFNDRYNNLLYAIGLNFSFGGAKAAKVAQPAPAPVLEEARPEPKAAPVVEEVKPQPKAAAPVVETVRPRAEAAPVVEEAKSQAQGAQEIVEKGRITLNVLFATGKAVIKKSSYKDIDDLGNVLKKYPDLKITIEGHTDNVGSAAMNKKLSQNRANAVKKYLVEKSGIAAQRLTAIGYGPARPVASNATREGRQKNRRVEVAAVDYIIKK